MLDLRTMLILGAEGRRAVAVRPELTVRHVYPSLPAVYATPQLINLMEMAAADAIAPFLPAGWGSVGARVDVRHLAATPVGCTVTAVARVTAIEERLVHFHCTAHDGIELVGDGMHVRAAVDLARFSSRVEAKTRTIGERQRA